MEWRKLSAAEKVAIAICLAIIAVVVVGFFYSLAYFLADYSRYMISEYNELTLLVH